MVDKPYLTIEKQIEHLKEKGVTFALYDEEKAKDYLLNHNNYFKLTAYRKNYNKHPDGPQKDKYINLDFAFLVDLAVIDMHLRYRIVHLALDIEHQAKLKLLRKTEEKAEDGYTIVSDYVSSLSETQKPKFESEINRNKGNVYCGNIIAKYNGKYPIWAFLEIIPFGRLVSFYNFCADRFADPEMKDDYFRLLTCKEIRNASAHSNCIINDLHSGTALHKTNSSVTASLVKIPKMKPEFRKRRMSNARVQQIVTLFYTHKTMVNSIGVNQEEGKLLRELINRMFRNTSFYDDNPTIKGTFDFLKMVVDNWFPSE